MRKLIATLSLGLSLVFAIALANASDEEATYNKEGSDKTMQQQPSQAQQQQEPGISADICRDQNGVEFRKGEKGFDTCQKEFKPELRNETRGQIQQKSHEKSLEKSTTTNTGTMPGQQ